MMKKGIEYCSSPEHCCYSGQVNNPCPYYDLGFGTHQDEPDKYHFYCDDLLWADIKEYMEEKEEEEKRIAYQRLLQIAGKMHTAIFLHCGDEYEVYDECGLTDEENQILGSIYVEDQRTVEIVVNKE